MAYIQKRSAAKSIETAIVHHLKQAGSLKTCAIVAHTETAEAPEKLPCIIVNCESMARHSDIVGFWARDAEVTVTIYADAEQTTETAFEKYAREMEIRLDNKATLQPRFNKPTSGRDYRKIRGVHLDEIIDFNAESTTDGTTMKYAVTMTLVVQEWEE